MIGFCILHERKKDKDPEEFKKALKSRMKTGDLAGVYFPYTASFSGRKFPGRVDFSGAVFSGDAYFFSAKFSGYTSFNGAVFSGYANFNGAKFSADADFTFAEFSGNVGFNDAEFSGYTVFNGAVFSGYAGFDDVWFSGCAIFSGSHFLREAYFKLNECRSLNIDDATFGGKVEFYSLESHEEVSLRGTRFHQGGRIRLDLSVPGVAKLEGAELEAVDFTACKWPPQYLIDTADKKDGMWPEIWTTGLPLKRLEELGNIYRRLKVSFQKAGDYSTSREFYYREKECERRAMIAKPPEEDGADSAKRMDRVRKRINRVLKIVKHLFWWQLLCRSLVGYGERPGRIVIWSLVLILLGSLFYYFGGVSLVGEGILHNETIRTIRYPTSQQPILDYLRCIYFSVVTFTTLGYGDIHASDVSKWFATFQAFTGMFMMALFAIVFGRKVMRG